MIHELLGQSNFAGRDGFYWWVGQVETQKGKQEKGDDRYKVRIVGQHLKDCNAVAYEDLPWAIVMMPATAPRREGGTNFTSVEYKSGDWVIGFFLDGRDGQQPVIMGSIGQQYKASSTHTGKEKPASECLAFTTFLDPDINLNAAAPATQAAAVAAVGLSGTGASTTTTAAAGAKPDLNQPPNVSNEAASNLLLGTKCCNSETNPGGEYFCVEVADAKCEEGTNDQSKFESVLSELFANAQNSGGQFGNKILSKYTGKLYDYIDIAQGYSNKTVRLASSIVARAKGEIFALIKKGTKSMIDFMLMEEVPTGEKGADGKPATKKVGRLRGITAWINEQLGKVNCVMEDLDEVLRKFIEDLIFDSLDKVFNAVRCVIDDLVTSIIDKIASFLEDAINVILGPLQSLLDIIASPLNIIGEAIAGILDMLGITCGGAKGCAAAEQTKDCSGPCGKDDAFGLDDLLEAIESGNLDTGAGNCAESQQIPPVTPTTVTIIGGTTNSSSYTGTTIVKLPPTKTPDPTTAPSTFGISPPGTTNGSGNSYITPSVITPTTSIPPGQPGIPGIPGIRSPNFNNLASPTSISVVGKLTINSSISASGTSLTIFISGATGVATYTLPNQTSFINIGGTSSVLFTPVLDVTDQETTSLSYQLTADKLIVFEGDSIKFTLVANGAVVPDGTVFNYAMFSEGTLTVDDFVDKTTVGTMTMYGNVATKTITIAEDEIAEELEQVTFNVKEALKTVPFTIAASDIKKDAVEPSIIQPAFTPPILGAPEVCADGRIMDIPIIRRGDAYLTPPLVVIRGAGFGSSAKVELDEEGYIKKVAVIRSGIGYAPKRTKLNCVVSGFAMISPGLGYYREPSVYIDGKSSDAKALIDSNGFVRGIDMVSKSKIYGCTPRVEVFGGNGLGAKAIPIMECRDDAQFVTFQTEVAPSGVDEVIDCP
jgi:hypothetical protein